jgi:hypothetical protein
MGWPTGRLTYAASDPSPDRAGSQWGPHLLIQQPISSDCGWDDFKIPHHKPDNF